MGKAETLLVLRDNSSETLQPGGYHSPDELHGDGGGLSGQVWDGFKGSDMPRHARCLVTRFILQGWRMPLIVGRKNSRPLLAGQSLLMGVSWVWASQGGHVTLELVRGTIAQVPVPIKLEPAVDLT
jgi:hypothetical protein